MAVYTVTVDSLKRNNFDFGLKDYPIFDEDYRAVLNAKILNHYLMREIGFETEGLFRHYLNTKMSEIMLYYNQLYLSERLKIDPFNNVDYKEVFAREMLGKSENTGNATQTSEGSQTSAGHQTSAGQQGGLSVQSDTPQTALAIGDIKNHTWASKADFTDNNTSDTSTTNATTCNTAKGASDTFNKGLTEGEEKHTLEVKGKKGGKYDVELLMLLRKTFLNIDLEIIKELNTCFMGVY